MKANLLDKFTNKLLDFPLWIKQIIFLRLYENLKTSLDGNFIHQEENNLFALYKGALSPLGKKELEEKTKGFDSNFYNFLKGIDENLATIDIALNNYLTFEEVAKYFVFAMEQDYIQEPIPIQILAMSCFMAGKFRTGEYFKRIGKIDIDKLETAIMTQKKRIKENDKAKIAEIMVDLGFITKEDTNSLLTIKEEAKKRFILDSEVIPKGVTPDKDEYLATIDSLKKQNNRLRNLLAKLLVIFKQDAK